MNVQAGRRAMPRRRLYSGRSGGAKRLREKSERKLQQSVVKLVICLSAFLVLLALKFIFPSGAEAVSRHLASGLDCKAAFSAIGKAITSGENIIEVFKGISLGGFRKDPQGSDTDTPEPKKAYPEPGNTPDVRSQNGDAGKTSSGISDGAEAVEAISVVDILDETDLPAGKTLSPDGPGSESADLAGDQSDDAFRLDQNDEYLEELLLRLPTSEFEDMTGTSENELPENVSYDYYVIEFDYTTPLKGNITSAFGYRKHPITGNRSFHYGVDIGASKGEIVSAFSSGTVELTGYNSIYGNYLFIRHKDGIITFYGHCSKILVDEGQLVRMGEAVAKVGSTGLSTGPHLHFEIRNGDMILDPLHYVSPES